MSGTTITKTIERLASPRRIFLSRLGILGLLLVLAAACSAVRLTDFQQFAAIGSKYTKAVDAALIRSGRLAIQANSMEMIENRELAAVSPESLKRQDQALQDFLGELALLRQQVIALDEYFHALAALSGSKAPEAFAAGLEQSASSLTSISQSLEARVSSGGRLSGRVSSMSSASAGAGKLFVAKKRMRVLERELRARDQAIDRILRLQEQLLETLTGIAEDDQGFVSGRTYEWTVARPFRGTEPLELPALWMADREAALLATPLKEHLALAVEATRQVRAAWGKLLAHDLGPLDLAVLAKSVDDALAGPVGIPAPATPILVRPPSPPAPRTPGEHHD